MNSQNFTTTIVVDNSPSEVFDAINNVRGWWSEEVEGSTNKLNDEWNYHYQDVHRCKIKIVELIPDKKVVWLVMDNYFSFTKDKSEWNGNQIIFEIKEIENKTQLRFTQVGLVPDYECYDICEGAWSTYIQKSLHSLITTGKGQPNGKDKPQTEDEANLAAHFTTSFFVDQSPEEVFNAINHVSDWWQGEIKGPSKNVNDEFEYRMPGIHFSKQKVIESIPNERVEWLVTDSNLNSFEDKQEWNGTKIIFDIREINGKTQLRFTHIGLAPQFQCYDDCSGAWEMLVQQSLFSLITTGKGQEVF
jgi:hypothetical protein